MEGVIAKLLDELCVDWGLCIPFDEANKIKKSDYLEADAFACSVLTAERLDADIEIRWRRRIRHKFIERFGTNKLYATDF